MEALTKNKTFYKVGEHSLELHSMHQPTFLIIIVVRHISDVFILNVNGVVNHPGPFTRPGSEINFSGFPYTMSPWKAVDFISK